MPDREKYIDVLSNTVKTVKEYNEDTPIKISLQCVEDILTLLKEQEAVEPLAKEDDSYECICGAIVGWDELDASGIVQARLNYCPFCGKPITWEGR